MFTTPMIRSGSTRRLIRLAGVVPVAVAAMAAPSAALAAGASFAVQVSGSRAPYFVLGGHAGRTVSGRVTVINVSSQAGSVMLSPADATTGQTSGAVYVPAKPAQHAVGSWLSLSRRRLYLAPHTSAVVPFRVTVPAWAAAGQHLGGIVATPVTPISRVVGHHGRASFRIHIVAQSVIAVEVNLPGARVQRLAITGLGAGAQPGYQNVLIGLASTGNALVRGSGTLKVLDGTGHVRLRRSFNLDTFVPDTRIEFPVQIHGRALAAGRYRGVVTVRWGRHSVTRSLGFAITPHSLAQTFGSSRTVAPATGGGSSLALLGGAIALAVLAFGLGSLTRLRRPLKA